MTSAATSRKRTRGDRRRAVRVACERRGVEILPLHGGCFWLYGPGVDIRTTDLAFVETRELKAHVEIRLLGRA